MCGNLLVGFFSGILLAEKWHNLFLINSTFSAIIGVSTFNDEDVNRCNCVLRYWHNRLMSGRANDLEASGFAWAVEVVICSGGVGCVN